MHKEIVDFYEFVKPRDFEEKIRAKLVDNLRLALRRDGRNFANAQLFPFGSFVSGLYLPTADMDVVVCSESFMKGGDATYLSAKNWLYKFRKLLTSQRIANYDSVEVIAHARIPLVKYVDKATGLRVDVSFENLGGVRAVDTFQRWKKEYPAMPALVTIIKHYLLMRGLNEPVNGGLGGFTVICLVVSMLQLMPEVQSGSLIPEHHLGEMLLEFLKLYGRDFKYRTNAISLVDPIGYIPKVRASWHHSRHAHSFTHHHRRTRSTLLSTGTRNASPLLTPTTLRMTLPALRPTWRSFSAASLMLSRLCKVACVRLPRTLRKVTSSRRFSQAITRLSESSEPTFNSFMSGSSEVAATSCPSFAWPFDDD